MRSLPRFVLLSLPILAGCEFAAFAPSTPASPGQPTAPTEVVALAGADLVVVEGARVQLNGAASRALTGAPALSWSQREGPAVVLSNPSSSTPVFTAPLGPARLVFELQAQADDKADVDEIAVEVAVELPPRAVVPAISESPADVAVDGPVLLEFRWPQASVPVVTPRCPLRGGVDVDVVGDVVLVSVEPARLPCSVVVDDAGLVDSGRRVSRAAAIVWPAGTPTVAATRVELLPSVVVPGAPVPVDDGLLLAPADGNPLEVVAGSFTAPRHPGRLLLSAERRQGSASGGVVVAPVDVVSSANAAPVVDGGADLRVRPGARFRVAATAVDADDDDVTIEVRQVLGAPAGRVTNFVDVLTAPPVAGTLLFHVIAFDGVAASAPDPVRVVVDDAAENRAPELVLPATLFTTPGRRFTIDASGARDDSGLIAAWEIVQDEADPVQVLEAAVDVPTVELTAGAAGERYRFRVSAYDEGSLGVTVEVEVVVEDAGPFVDAIRGSDLTGNGSATAPFASVSAALPTAGRHRFEQLLLAAGQHAPLAGRLPDGLGLRGGFVFNDVDGGYDDDGARSLLPLTGSLFVAGGDLAALSITGTVVVSQDVRVDDADITRVSVEVGGRASASGCAFEQLELERAAAVVADSVIGALVSASSTTEVQASEVGTVTATGGGLFVVDVDSALGPTTISAGVNAVLGATLRGQADPALPALAVDDATVTLQGAVIVGVDVAVVLASATLRGSAVIQAARAGISGSGTVDLQDARVDVVGDATAAALEGDLLVRLTRARVTSTGVGLVARDVRIEASILRSAGVVVDVDSGALRHATLISAGIACDLGPGVTLDNVIIQAVDVGVLPPILGHVGFVVDGLDRELVPGCAAAANCFFTSGGALTADGHLSDELLHPFVDVGSVDAGVLFDVDGDALPQGAGPELGADERAVDVQP